MAVLDEHEAISRVVREMGLDIDPGVVVEIVHAAFAPRETLTADERSFLGGAGVPADSFEPRRQAEARARQAARNTLGDRSENRHLSTAEVADLLGRAPSNVRRSVASKDLYAISQEPQRELAFPGWQFVDARPVRGLRAVLTALPASMHPRAVESFMVTDREELGDMSPVVWLSTGGDPSRAAWLAESLARA